MNRSSISAGNALSPAESLPWIPGWARDRLAIDRSDSKIGLFSPALIALVMAVIVGACGAPFPSPTSLPQPSPTAQHAPPTVTVSPTLRPTPTPTLTPTPTASQAATLHVDGMATVMVDGLRQLADPANPGSHDFEKSGMPAERILVPLKQGDPVYIVGGPRVENGTTYWQIADGDYPGCCAPFGWVREQTLAGAAALVPSAPACPDAGHVIAATALADIGLLASLACFRSTELTVTGSLSCSQPIADGPAFIEAPWEADPEMPVLCSLDERLGLVGEPVRPFLRPDRHGVGQATVTGHFDDPGARDCRWIPGNYMNVVPPTGGPAETADFACRVAFYVTSVSLE